MPKDSDKLMRQLAKADREVTNLKARYEAAAAKRGRLIVEASETHSRAEIAQALGMSVGRIQQIVNRERARAGR